MKKILKALLATAIIASIALYFEYRDSASSLPAETKAILTTPDSVSAFRTVGFLENAQASENPNIETFYQKETNSVPVPPEVAQRVTEILLAKDRHADFASACIYTPGLALTFNRGGKSADVFFCFECGGITLKKSDEAASKDLGLILKYHQELLQIFKKLFPTDQRVQEL